MTTSIANQRAYSAMVRGFQRAHDYDLSRWPADVQESVEAVCQLWHLHPPTTKNVKALWIRDTRALIDACGEFGTEALKQYRDEFEFYMQEHQGVAFHTVSGPGSLVKMVTDKARRMREEGYRDDSNQRYITGKYADIIEHG